MADYKPGDMDTATQEETYDEFWKWTIRTSIFVGVILVLMYLFVF